MRGIVVVIVCVIAVFLCSIHLSAEEKKERLISPNDTLLIVVLEDKNLTTQTTVRNDGQISFPIVGELKAKGLSVAELTQKITQLLRGYLKDPQVNITISESKKETIYVIGEVEKPGQFEIPYPMSALRALTIAGGSKTESADLDNVRLVKASKNGDNRGEVIPLNLRELAFSPNPEETEVLMASGDILIIPSMFEADQINVLGYVQKPGRYKVKGKLSFIEALALGGGAIEELTDLSNVKIIRKDGRIINVNYKDIKPGAEPVEVWPGDTLSILNGQKISVIGYVNNPGQYQVKSQVDIVEALSIAGGPVEEEANLKKVRILRKDGKKEIVNASKIWEGKEKEKNILLNSGDTLIVPKAFSVNWNAVYIVIVLLVTLESIVRKN